MCASTDLTNNLGKMHKQTWILCYGISKPTFIPCPNQYAFWLLEEGAELGNIYLHLY